MVRFRSGKTFTAATSVISCKFGQAIYGAFLMLRLFFAALREIIPRKAAKNAKKGTSPMSRHDFINNPMLWRIVERHGLF